jgi:hypothetical protein
MGQKNDFTVKLWYVVVGLYGHNYWWVIIDLLATFILCQGCVKILKELFK